MVPSITIVTLVDPSRRLDNRYNDLVKKFKRESNAVIHEHSLGVRKKSSIGRSQNETDRIPLLPSSICSFISPPGFIMRSHIITQKNFSFSHFEIS